MKKLLLTFLFFAGSAFAVEPIQLFVMAGQSNMLGAKGRAEKYPKAGSEIDRSIAFYWAIPDAHNTIAGLTRVGSDGWGTLEPQSGLFGPEVTFARAAAKDMREVGVFKYSLGSTSLYYDWGGPRMGGLYDDMVSTYAKSFFNLRKMGHPVQLRGLIWVQGESDAETAYMADQYYFRLRNLIKGFREASGYEHLPVVLGVDEQHPDVKKHPQVVEAQKKLASQDPCITFVSMIGLPKADETHLTPAGLVEHGKRLYAGWQRIVKRAECR